MAHLRAALVTPLNGPLSLYGRAGATALAIWAKSPALPPPWTSVALDVRDTGKDIRAAMQAALATEPDVLSDHMAAVQCSTPHAPVNVCCGTMEERVRVCVGPPFHR